MEAYALKLLSLMRSAVQLGLETDDPIDGVVGRHASRFLETARSRMDLGFLTLGMAYAQAVMEHSNTGKVIVCAPTGGATGILPATLVGYADQYDIADADLVKPLMAAGLRDPDDPLREHLQRHRSGLSGGGRLCCGDVGGGADRAA